MKMPLLLTLRKFLVCAPIIIGIQISIITTVSLLQSTYAEEDSTSSQIGKNSSISQNNIVNLSKNGGHSEGPKLVIVGNNVYVIWVDDSSGSRDLYFRKSTTDGCNFDPTIDVSNQRGASIDPQIAVSGNKIYLVWEHTPGSNGAVFFTRSTNGGDTFESSKNIGNNTGMNGFPQVAVSGSNVYLVWHDASKGILFARSTDNGTSFTNITNIGNNTGFNGYPQIAVSGDNVYVLWINNADKKYGQIFFTRSTNGGVSFEKPSELGRKTDHENGRVVFSPRLSVDLHGNNVYMVWHSGRIVHQHTGNIEALISDVFYKRSTNNGTSFGKTINLSNYSGLSTNPQIAVSKNNTVYVVWTNTAQQKYGVISFARSTDNGASFDRTINLSNYSGLSTNPQIAVSKNNTVHVVWVNNATGNEEIVLKTTGISNNCSYPISANTIKTADRSFLKQLKIGFVDPTFTFAAYDSSFYLFYEISNLAGNFPNVTHYTDLLSSKVPQDTRSLRETDDIMLHLKWLLPESHIEFISDQDVHNGSRIFGDRGQNLYNALILSHQEYVTQREYDNLKKFVSNGGILILLDGNVFYAEVKYDEITDTITFVKGHDWAFDGNSAWRSVPERWQNETSQWMGSNYLCCYGDDIIFRNNPFNIKHDEEQYITNSRAKILLDYNATENKPNPRNFVIATYAMEYGNGKVLTLGLYTDDLKGNHRFWSFFDSLLFEYVLGDRVPK